MFSAKKFAAALVGVALVGVVGLPTTAKAADPIVLKGLIPWTADFPGSYGFFAFQKAVNKALKGKVIISLIGGPEVVPPFEQFEAVRDGVVDVLMTAGAYYRSTIPEAAAQLGASKRAEVLRTNGWLDAMREIHKEHGVYYHSMVSGNAGNGYRCYSNVDLKGADLTGLKMRVSPTYVPLVTALNGTPILMKAGEVYTALERKVVNGFCWTFYGIRDYGFHEVTKYVINQPFYSGDQAILINLKTWNSLPADARAAIEGLGAAVEADVEKYITGINNKEDAALKKEGMKFIEFGAAESQKWQRAAYDSQWKEIAKKSPKWAAKLETLGK